MEKSELSAGVYVAQGPEINILIRLAGKSPLLSVISAMDLNSFYKEGKIVELDTHSLEVQDILMYPEKYKFETLNTSSTVDNESGYDDGINRDENSITEDFIKTCIPKYQQFLRLTNSVDEAKVKMKIWLKREHEFSISQGEAFINKLITYMKPQNIA